MFNVAVIGCGVIGLTTALSIQKKCRNSVHVTIFSKEFSPNTTGDIAAGLWTPYLVGDTPEEDVIRWSNITQDYILSLWKAGKASEYGVSLQPIIAITDKQDFETPNWAKLAFGYHKFNKEELERLSNKYRKNIEGGFSFVSFTWEATTFLPVLQQTFIKNGGTIKQQEVRNFEELKHFDVIVNCAGLNARLLTADNSLVPIRGQIMYVSAPWQYHAMYLDICDENYIIPNIGRLILGGTHQERDYSCQVDEKDIKHIADGCSYFVPALRTARVIGHVAGLRPGRHKVRLELEEKLSQNGCRMLIVHNYGHGGSGITLSVGCADEASELVRKAIASKINKL